jgi:hypothetical protein
MQPLLRLPLLALMSLMAAWAAPAAAAPRGDEVAARTAVLARFDAALRADTAALERLLADDLEYCNFRGECERKSQYIGQVKSGTLKYHSINGEVDRVKLFADTAAVTGKVVAHATRDGVERAIRASFLAVLVWRDDRWQLTSWSTTLLNLSEKK